MLKQRIITAVILVLGILSALFLLTPFWFAVTLIIVAIAGAWEWAHLAKLQTYLAKSVFFVTLVVVMALLGNWLQLSPAGGFHQANAQLLCLVAVVVWGFNFLWIQGYPSSAILWGSKPVLILLGLVLLACTWASLAVLLQMPNGRWLFLMMVGIIACADTGGYFAGRQFGKHKLAPVVSPGKTWEGLCGGLLAQALPIGVALAATSGAASFEKLLLLTIPVALFSVIGDLFESMVKRFGGVKDSGEVLPGHGGVLDRIDGFIAAVPMFTLILLYQSPF